ncbi:MAG: amidase [Hyphomicrobiaceae bacterium]
MAMRTIWDRAKELAEGATSAEAIAEEALARIADPAGEGGRAFVHHDPEKVRAFARQSDEMRRRGVVPSPLAGLPVSLKDLFDVAGEVTRAGSRILDGTPAAARDSVVAARLRAAGAVLVGRTNMTEFAYGGIGFNPHYGTPAAPYDRATGRVPGGSSSGAAVSVADGMAVAGIGTDTGGSCRIPAAFCGVVGYKPSQPRVSREGCFPLSDTLDSIGPLAASVADCALVDQVIAGRPVRPLAELPARGLRLAIPTTYVMDDLEKPVADAFSRAISRLSSAGAHVHEAPFRVIGRMPELFVKGGIGGGEAFALHRPWLETRYGDYDPKVATRLEIAREQSVADYLALRALRAEMVATLERETVEVDALVFPTVAIIPPAISSFGDHQSLEDYTRVNGRSLRNTYVGNAFDRCAISIPCHGEGEPPVGLMLVGAHGADDHLFRLALAIERRLAKV